MPSAQSQVTKPRKTTVRLTLTPEAFPAIIDKDGSARPDTAQIPELLKKREAARFVSQFYFETTFRALERWPLRAIVVNGSRRWYTRDLMEFARNRIRTARPSHPPTGTTRRK
jgi:hypothetical protein